MTRNPVFLRCKEERNNEGFFKVLQSVDVFSENVRALPHDFARSISDKDLSRKMKIKAQWGSSWEVGISKNPRFYFMEKTGWEKFVRDNALGHSEFITFTHKGKMHFTVNIFKQDGKEMIQPPQSAAFLASSSRIKTEQREDVKKEEVVSSDFSNRGPKTTAALVEKSRQKPPERMASLTKGLKNSNYNADPVLQESGVSIISDFTQVEARILPTPKLKVGNGEDVSPCIGRWNFSNKLDEDEKSNRKLKSGLYSLQDKRKDAVKEVIAAMTVGKDASSLFTDVVNCMQTENLELKKVSQDPNPLIRALAVRTMGCIRVDKITEYLCDPLQKCLMDDDPYARKTAAICVARLFDINAELVEDRGFLEALAEIQENSTSPIFEINTTTLTKLLTALSECTEWGQVFILDALSKYNAADTREAENIVERVTPHANCAVVLSAVKVVLNNATVETDNPDLRDRAYIYWRLLSTDPEAAKDVVLTEKHVITDDSKQLGPSLLDELLTNISTLSSVYHKPPEAFVTRLKTTVQKTEDEDFAEGSEAGYSSGNPVDSAAFPPASKGKILQHSGRQPAPATAVPAHAPNPNDGGSCSGRLPSGKEKIIEQETDDSGYTKYRTRKQMQQGKNAILKKIRLFVDLETVTFDDERRANLLEYNVNKVLAGKSEGGQTYLCGLIDVYMIKEDTRKYHTICSGLTSNCITRKPFAKRLLCCRWCRGEDNGNGRSGSKEKLLQGDMLVDISIHAMRLKEAAEKRNDSKIKTMMILSGDPFFKRVCRNLELAENGGFKIFEDLPSGMRLVPLDTNLQDNIRCCRHCRCGRDIPCHRC